MKTHADCLPCLLRQSLQVARITNCSAEKQLEIVQTISGMLAEVGVHKSPPENAAPIYKKIAELTGCEDPYLEKKRISNEQASQMLAKLREEVHNSEQPLLLAVRFAIAGNIIDYGALHEFDIEETLEVSRSAELAVDDSSLLLDAINGAEKGTKLLYLADNSGEIVFDSLLIESLHEAGFDITIAVKDGPIINDALTEDAYSAGLNKFGRIISNGTRCPGTIPEKCSLEFLEAFNNAELIISKGQGNFESLSETKRDIFFLLTLKCVVAANHMAELAGVDSSQLIGMGEMAVYFSNEKIREEQNEKTD